MVARRVLLATMLMTVVFLGGCKSDTAVKQGATTGPSPKQEVLPAEKPTAPAGPSSSITGTILFSGKAAVKTIDTSMDPACSLGTKPTLPTEQYVVKGSKLANVFIYVKSGPREAMTAVPANPGTVVLDQKNCQYVPHVIGVMQGGYVQFRNSDPTMHNVHTMPTDAGNQTIDISEGPRGQPQTKQFTRPELMMPVRCNNHPWMNAFINVSATPFFAVSDSDGHFDLRGLPPGDYVIGAVHEKLGEKTLKVTVAANSTAKAQFGFTLQ